MDTFSIWDYVIVALYIIASLAIGLKSARKQKTVADYFVADRSAKWWAVAISAVATGLSAISYLGVPAWVYERDLQLFAVIFLLPVIMLVVVYLFVPLLARMRVMTIYEYLEARFNIVVRSFASALFLLMRGGWLATAIYTQGLLIMELVGLPLWISVCIIGLLTAVYTIVGGIEAVLWTDVMQFFVLLGGLFIMGGVVIHSFGGDVAEIWRIASESHHTRMFDFKFSLFQFCFWAILLNNIIDNLSTYGSDQIMVQRFLTTRNASDMRRAVMLTGFITVPIVVLLMGVGICLVAFYQTHPALAEGLTRPDRVVPHFIRTSLPVGLAGLVIAGVFAATMSTLSGGFNSLATATYVDFIRRFRRNKAVTNEADVKTARTITFLWAAFSTVMAFFVGHLGNIVEIFGKISGFFSGPILGIFLLGLLTRRPGSVAAMAAISMGTFLTWLVSTTDVTWLWYSPVGCLSTLITGCVLGVFNPKPEKPRELTAVATPLPETV